jgi:hypothetical protein
VRPEAHLSSLVPSLTKITPTGAQTQAWPDLCDAEKRFADVMVAALSSDAPRMPSPALPGRHVVR